MNRFMRKGHRDPLPKVKIDCGKCLDKPCCKMVVVKLDKKAFRDAKKEDGIRYLELHGFKIYVTSKKNILLGIPAICKALDEYDRCKIWDERPGICQRNFLEFDETGGLLCPPEAIEETGVT